jgi:amidohydrolase
MKISSHIIQFRKSLHADPELSGKEYRTKDKILNFFKQYKPDKIYELSETGLAFCFEGKKAGKTIMFRADTDALPFDEENNIAHRSNNPGVMHACGHDGHSAILAALAEKLHLNPPQKGRAVLLFQPAEETGQGAYELLKTREFKQAEPDYIFGLHNIPGEEKHSVLLKEGSFASASEGMIIELKGKSSHAAEPENGNSPVWAVKEIIAAVKDITDNKKPFKDFVLITPIHIKMGEQAFGTTPGRAVIMLTLRSYTNEDMSILRNTTKTQISEIAEKHKLQLNISYTEVFPATENHQEAFRILEKVAKSKQFKIHYNSNPYRWSEDFGNYLKNYPGAFFGLGSGLEQPKLHNPDYDFPDEIIATGSELFYGICEEFLYDNKSV